MKQCFNKTELQALGTLVDMGFARDECLLALLTHSWNVDEAVDALISPLATGEIARPPQPLAGGKDLRPVEAAAVQSAPSPRCSCGKPLSVHLQAQVRCCSYCPHGHTRTCLERDLAWRESLLDSHSDAATVAPAPAANSCERYLAEIEAKGHRYLAEIEAKAEARETALQRMAQAEGSQTVERQVAEPTHEVPSIAEICRDLVPGAPAPPSPRYWLGGAPPPAPLAPEANPDSDEQESDTVAPPAPGGYVLLEGPSNVRRWLGYHPVTWAVLEERVGQARGTLAGRLSAVGLNLRKASDVATARRLWTAFHGSVPMPQHPRC